MLAPNSGCFPLPLPPTISGLDGHEDYEEFLSPSHRPWIAFANQSTVTGVPSHAFTVLSYNILCESYATSERFDYCPDWALSWIYRKKRILMELKHYSADIICLQEISGDAYNNFFLPALRDEGYEGIFGAKSRTKTMSLSQIPYVDGCAIFYKRCMFDIMQNYMFEFNQLAKKYSAGSRDMLNRVQIRDNIAVLALLKPKFSPGSNGEPGKNDPLLVCTPHLHWNPDHCDVKLVQTMLLIHELKLIAEEYESRMDNPDKPAERVKLLLCGDFNSLPDSGVVAYLKKSSVSIRHPDFKNGDYQECLRRLNYYPDYETLYTNGFDLASAYSDDIMPYTNYTFKFQGTIDYIFHESSGMKLLGLLGPISCNWIKENNVVGAPHKFIPSGDSLFIITLPDYKIWPK